MKLESILLGRSTRAMRIIQPPGGIHLQRAVHAMEERYGFIQVPKTLAEYDETKGVNFRHGKFTVIRQRKKNEIVIDALSIYSDGLLAEARSYTDDTDSFLDDVVAWGTKEFALIVPPDQKIENYYISNLEISLDSDLHDFFSAASLVAKQLSGCLTNYGTKFGPFDTTSFTMNFDRKEHMPSILSNFTLQRREGVPFSSRLYFSSAPLKTEDHMSLLQVLDSFKPS